MVTPDRCKRHPKFCISAEDLEGRDQSLKGASLRSPSSLGTLCCRVTRGYRCSQQRAGDTHAATSAEPRAGGETTPWWLARLVRGPLGTHVPIQLRAVPGWRSTRATTVILELLTHTFWPARDKSECFGLSSRCVYFCPGIFWPSCSSTTHNHTYDLSTQDNGVSPSVASRLSS